MESSGSIKIDVDYPIVESNTDGSTPPSTATVKINRDVPEFGTADVAYYAIFYKVDTTLQKVHFDTRDFVNITNYILEKGLEPGSDGGRDSVASLRSGSPASDKMVYQIPVPSKYDGYSKLDRKTVIHTQEEFDFWLNTMKKEEFPVDEFINVWENKEYNQLKLDINIHFAIE